MVGMFLFLPSFLHRCRGVFLFVTHKESAGCCITFIMLRTKQKTQKFTIICQKVVSAFLQKLHHARKLEFFNIFEFLFALIAENFLLILGEQQLNCISEQHLLLRSAFGLLRINTLNVIFVYITGRHTF